MAESSNGRQHHRTSRLRDMQRPPDSDTVAPEAQPKADEFGIEDDDDIEIDQEDLAIIANCSIQKSTGSAPAASQAYTVPPQSLFVRPDSATTEPPNLFAKRVNDKKLSKEQVPTMKLSVRVDTAVAPIAPTVNDAMNQDNSIRSVSWSRLPSLTVEECAPDELPKILKTAKNHDRDQLPHEKSVSVKTLRIEPVRTAPLDVSNESHATPKPATQAAPARKKKSSSKKAKKVKKILLFRPTQPWPPRFGLSTAQSNTQAITDPPTRLSAAESNTTAGQSPPFVDDLAVKVRVGGAPIPDGPLVSEHASSENLIAKSTDASNGDQAVNGAPAVSSICAEQAERAVQRPHLDVEAEQSIDIAELCVDRYSPSVSDSDEAHDQYPQAQQSPVADTQAPESLLSTSDDGPSPRNKTSTPNPALKPNELQHARHPVQQLSSNDETSQLTSIGHPTRTRTTQEVLHGTSSRSGSVRVTKAYRPTKTAYDLYSKTPAANGNQQLHLRTTTLDMALDAFRTACLSDQYQLEDRMTLRENSWNDERLSLQTTITEQLETIAEQRVKLEHSEKRFTNLTEKVKSSQKFISGLQKDHEKLQKAMIATQEQNKRTLQDQIETILSEKKDLQVKIEAMVYSCEKSQKGMFRTMKELHLRYVTAISREKDLKGRLDEQVALHREEKNRRTVLEQQVLPSVQGLQRHLDEGSAKLAEEVSSFRASTESRVAKDRSHSTTKECLLILQKLQSLPLLTSNDVRKVEAMLRSLHERTEAGFDSMTRTSERKRQSIEEIRQHTRDQIQGLQSDILRHDQAIADAQLAGGAFQTLMTEAEMEKQNNQQLEQQLAAIQQSEAALKIHVTELETETDSLRTAAREYEAQLHDFGLEITHLQERLRGTKGDLHQSDATIKQLERQYLEQQLQFTEYKTGSLSRLAELSEHSQGQIEATDRQCDAFKQDIANLQIELKSEQTRSHQLDAETLQYNSTIQKLRQEKHNAIEKECGTRTLLRSAEDSVLELEDENQKISGRLEEALADLCTSKHTEQKLTMDCSELQRQLHQLHDASKEQLQQVRCDNNLHLQQAETAYSTNIDELNSRLKCSEELREDLQAKLSQMEAVHERQTKSTEQEFIAKFASLAAQSQHERELMARLRQETESRGADAGTQTINMELSDEQRMRETVDDMVAETEKRRRGTELPTIRTLVPNTQQSELNGGSSNQHPQPEKTSNVVGRQVNSVTFAGASTNLRLDTAEGEPVVNRASNSDRPREGSEGQVGYFEEQYESRFGPQTPLQNQETQFSLVNSEVEVVPETQDFEYGQGGLAHFEVIESQVIDVGDANQEEDSTDLSTIPSESLSEMLLDYPKKRPHTPQHALPAHGEPGMSRSLAHDMSSDAHSTDSRGRPKSRANTASRMTPLPGQDTQRQGAHTDEDSRHLSRTCVERSVRADEGTFTGFAHSHDANPKRTYDRRSARDIDSSHKRKAAGSIDESGSFRKPRTTAQAFVQGPSSVSRNHAPYTPAPTNTPSRSNINPSPASATGRRPSFRKSSRVGSQGATTRLSSTRNTRSKTNRYADRFADELGRH